MGSGARGKVSYPLLSRVLGTLAGLVFALMPWRTAMKSLASGTAPFMAEFKSLLADASEEDRAFFQFVLDHEIAIEAFALKEAGGEADSEKPIKALLEGKA